MHLPSVVIININEDDNKEGSELICCSLKLKTTFAVQR